MFSHILLYNNLVICLSAVLFLLGNPIRDDEPEIPDKRQVRQYWMCSSAK